MQQCPDKNDFVALLDNALSDSAAAEIEEHLSCCEVCEQQFQLLLKEERRAWETWRELDAHHHTESSSSVSTFSKDLLFAHLHRQGYSSIEEIGRGGMGIVYRAHQQSLDRDVAIKILTYGGLSGPERIRRFSTEAKAIGKLNHPNILQIFAIDYFQDVPYLILEFVGDGDLAERLQPSPLSERHAAELCSQLAQALGHAHAAGIVHRDIKPSNILFSGGVSRLADFGLAKFRDDDQGLTDSQAVIGTPAYMSPEQVGAASEAIGPSSDIYSLGIVLYESLCGFPPFRSSNPAESLRMISEQEPIPPRRIQPKLSRDVNTICLKCLSKSPSERYLSADQLNDDLERLLSGRPILARPIGPVSKLFRWAKRAPVAASLASLTAILAISFLALWANFTLQLKEQRDAVVRETEFANENFRRAHLAIREYLVSFRSHTPLGSKKNLAFQEETIGNGLRFYEDLLRNSDRVNEFRAEPEALVQAILDYAELQFEFGKVMAIAKKPSEAIDAYQAAIELTRDAERSSPDAAVRANQLRGSIHASAVSPLRQLGENERALAVARQSLQCYEHLARAGAYGPDYANWYQAIAWFRIGQMQATMGKLEDAWRSLENAETLAARLPSILDFRLTFAQIGIEQSELARLQGAPETAVVRALNASEVINDVCRDADYRLPRYEATRARAYLELARCSYVVAQTQTTRIEDAVADYDTAIRVLEALVRRYPDVEQYRAELTSILIECTECALPADRLDGYRAKLGVLQGQRDTASSVQNDKLTHVQKQVRSIQNHLELQRFKAAAEACESALRELQGVGDLQELNAEWAHSLQRELTFHLAESYFAQAEFEAARNVLLGQVERNQDLYPEAAMILNVASALLGKRPPMADLISRNESCLPSSNRYAGFGLLLKLLTSELNSEPIPFEYISSLVKQLQREDLQSPIQLLHSSRAVSLVIEHLRVNYPDDSRAVELVSTARQRPSTRPLLTANTEASNGDTGKTSPASKSASIRP